ncbi:amidohydrolase family-domain-containing protein [Flammula alnicola]|nr:amidohydrolase family-domain-containing protein [Flammula alnicola]
MGPTGISAGEDEGCAQDKDKVPSADCPIVGSTPSDKRPSSRWSLIIAVASIALACLFTARRAASTRPDTYAICSKQDKVYIVDAENSQTQCIVVEGAYIADIGSLDSHGHILEYGATQQLPLESTKSIQDAVARVRQYILSTPDVYNNTSKVITGGGWDHTVWPTAGWPTAADLDADSVIRGRPVVLQSKDCHALWVSSKAIEVSLPFPEIVEGGVIVRDGVGKPTARATESDLLRRFKVAIRDALSYGLTSIHDAGLDPTSLAFFKRFLPSLLCFTSPHLWHDLFDENKPYWGNTTHPIVGAGDGRLSARSVKIFADGALRTGGSALYEPYADNPTTRGFMRIDTEVLYDVIPKFLQDGWQVNVHAIGDRANGIVLDVFEASLKGVNVTASRPRLEHAQMMTKADMVRLGKLGVIASIDWSVFMFSLSNSVLFFDRFVGPERVKSLYAFRSLVDSGAKITLGSDFPVESMNPLSGFYAAITRKSATGQSPHGPDGWFPEQRLTRQEALRGMTIDPAYASFTETTLGSLEIGKRADFTILSQDIMTIPAEDILATKVHATVIDGKPVYGSI